MKIGIILIAFLLMSFMGFQKLSPSEEGNYELVWSDEFDYEGLPDETKWSYDVGDGCPHVCGWGNNELQYYTKGQSKNARVDNGMLTIEAHKEYMLYKSYTSARIVSKHKGDWTYGKIEVKAKMPSGKGTWPAIWMLPTENTYGGWPRSGEIDIMEHVGYEADAIHGTVHTQAYNHNIGTQKGGKTIIDDCETAFHTYSVLWDTEGIDFLVDGETYFRFDNENKGSEEWPFNQPFHLIMNIAVGGNWGGKEGVDKNIWPQKMEVDYVRVYKKRTT